MNEARQTILVYLDRVTLAFLSRMWEVFEGKHFGPRKYAALSVLHIFSNKILMYSYIV